jgi:group I intron endonuclease
MNTGIYTITNLQNNKIYVGSTLSKFNKRFNQHKHLLRNNKHPNIYLQNSWNKYGESCFRFEILDFELPENCLEIENYWMNLLNTKNLKFGYNILSPTKNRFGLKHTEESKIKMRLAQLGEKSHRYGKPLSKEHVESLKKFHTGRKHSEETKSKISINRKGKNLKEDNPFYGKKHSKETLEKLKNISTERWKNRQHPNLGKKASDELRKKLSDSHKGIPNLNKKIVYQYTLEKVFIKEWSCAKEAADFLNKTSNTPIQACCTGRTKKAFNFIWSYIKLH